MVDITIVFMGFINQQTSLGGHHPVVTISLLTKPPGVAPDLASAIALAALAGIASPNC